MTVGVVEIKEEFVAPDGLARADRPGRAYLQRPTASRRAAVITFSRRAIFIGGIIRRMGGAEEQKPFRRFPIIIECP
jgi:hypothetical protein